MANPRLFSAEESVGGKSPGNEVANKAGSVYIAMLQKFEKEEVN